MGESRARRYAVSARSLAARSSGRQRVGAGVAVLLLLTAPFGGLRAAPDPGPERLAAGAKIHVGPYDVVVDRVVTVSDLAPQIEPERKGDRLVVVVATVHNPTDRPEYGTLLTRALSLRDAGVVVPESGAASQLVSVEDGEGISTINPGLTYEVAFVAEQEAGWTRQDVTVGFRGYTYQEEDPLTLDPKSWLLGADLAQSGRFPVKVNR